MKLKNVILFMGLIGTLALQACGGGGSSANLGPSFTVIPALGAVFNANVSVIDATGHVIASGSTGVTGLAALQSAVPITAPVVIQVSLVAGQSSYFDEKSQSVVNVTSTTNLYSMALGIAPSAKVGVSLLTHMAAKLAGVSDANASAAGLTNASVATSVAEVNLTLGLPPAYNILQAPASVATNPNNIPTTNYAGLLAIIAQENTSPNALTQAIVVANAVSTHSVIDYPALAPLVSVVAANSASLLGLAAPAAVTTNAELTSRAASNLNSVLNSILTGATGATGASN